MPDNRWEATTAAHDLHDAPQWLCFMDVCVYVFAYAVCHGPTVHVVTGRIPGTMFVYTEPLTHPNNQPLWAFLIPTQSQWSQVELATGEIRYSNTASWSTSRGLSFPHPLSPLCFLYCNSQRDTDLKLTGCIQKAGPAWLHCFASLYLAGQLNFCFGIFLFVFILFARSRSATYKSKQAAVVWRNTHSLAKECISELVYCYGFGYVGTHFATPGVRVWFCMRACVYTDRSMWRNIH